MGKIGRLIDRWSDGHRFLVLLSTGVSILSLIVMGEFGYPAGGLRTDVEAYDGVGIVVDAGVVVGKNYPRFEQGVAQIHLLKGPKDQQMVKDLNVKLSRGFVRLQHLAPSEGVYKFDNAGGIDKFYMHTQMLDELRQIGVKPVLTLGNMPEWLADTSGNGGVYTGGHPPKDYLKWETVLFDVLKYYKNKYPDDVEWIEFWNEPDCCSGEDTVISQNDYNKMYRSAVAAVKRVNAGLASGVVKLKIGGPTMTHLYHEDRMISFLNYVKANNLQLDFVSWHDYDARGYPAKLGEGVARVKGWLRERGLVAKTFITEWQDDAGFVESATPELAARMATFAVAGSYYLREAGLDVGTIFSLSDYANPNRALLAPAGSWTGLSGKLGRSEEDGFVMPVYNVSKMMAMLGDDRLLSTGASLDSGGRGVGVVGTRYGNEIRVLLWNYRGSGSTANTVNLKINNLPEVFAQGGFVVETYLVDKVRSNSLVQAGNGTGVNKGLEKVTNSNFVAGRSSSVSVDLLANSVALVRLIPGVTGTVPSSVPPTPTTVVPTRTVPTPTIVSPLPTSSGVGELVTNGGFSNGKTGWGFYDPAGADFQVLEGYSGKGVVVTARSGHSGTDIQLYQSGRSLVQGAKYRLTFYAKSSGGSDMWTAVIKHGAPYTNYGLRKASVDLGSVWKKYSFEFVASGFVGNVLDGRVMFFMSDSAKPLESYSIDEVSLIRLN